MESLKFIGKIKSVLSVRDECPLQENEDAPQASLIIESEYTRALKGLTAGSEIILLTWLHLADRNLLLTKPRNRKDGEDFGVFATRSPDRPNPIGLHRVRLLYFNGQNELIVSALEVVDGTPLIDIKPAV